MKTILVPTDFSAAAFNATEYAAEIARLANARLILFHVYSIPVMPAEAPIAMPVDEMEEDATRELRKLKARIASRHGGDVLLIEQECRLGFPAEEIRKFAEECNADLIVMGMEGSDTLTEKLIGSITTTLIQKTACPVLAIGRNVRFRSIKKIVFACDYSRMDTRKTLSPLRELAQLFKADVFVLNVVPQMEAVPTVHEAVEGIKLDHVLEGINHSFSHTVNEDVMQGINHFVDLHGIDMVAMVPHHHRFFQRLFHEPNTQKAAFHVETPLLVLHEQEIPEGKNN